MALCVVSELQASPAPLPSDQLLCSGAVIFPGKSCGQSRSLTRCCVARSDDALCPQVPLTSTDVLWWCFRPRLRGNSQRSSAQRRCLTSYTTVCVCTSMIRFIHYCLHCTRVTRFTHYCLRLHKRDTLHTLLSAPAQA